MLLRAQELPLTLASQGAGVQGKHGSSCRPLQATSNENRGSGCSGSALGPRAAAHKQACRKQPSGWAAAQHCAQGPCQGSGDTGIQPQILLHCQAQAEKDMGTSSAEGLILRPWIFFFLAKLMLEALIHQPSPPCGLMLFTRTHLVCGSK